MTRLPFASPVGVTAMESENRNLAACLIYRSLLVSILERGYTKAYPHGVRYLKKLDKLSETITDWKRFHRHEAFKDRIIQAHGRKRSFWSKYEAKKRNPLSDPRLPSIG
jgi:hypothetical protein